MENLKADNLIYKYGIERIIVSIIVNLIFGFAILVGLKSFELTLFYAIIISTILSITGFILLTKRLPVELKGILKTKTIICILWGLVAFASLIQTARLSIFMIEPAKPEYSLFPSIPWYVEHCCLTAYTEAARLNNEGITNIYNPENYLQKVSKDANGFPIFRRVSNFKVDLYHYPPTFLLLPTTITKVVGQDFLNIRMLWFSISMLSLMIALGFIIFRLEVEGRLRMLGMAPLIWCSLPVLAGLQMSNVQVLVISISIIAMLMFTIQKATGGLLLAMGTVAKIFPGILIVYLLAQKKFKEFAWISGFAIILSLLAFVVVGPLPFKAFIEYELPKLSSGEAFSTPLSRVFAVARNMAPFGIPLKLNLLGIEGMSLETGRIFSLIFLLIVLALAIWSGRQKPRTNTEAISVWISLLSLGSLVSPFAPANYVLIPVVILICLNREIIPVMMAVFFWVLLSLPFLISQQAPFIIQALFSLPAQIISLVIPGVILYRAGLSTTKEKDSEMQIKPAV
ncbi:MAG TPA: glycosyltransferase family 87 protein [Ignavibacteriaceae bacterium]|nr:glycosyltransferase family 87 protein [Ignavibacteriaceae bacterium]